MHRTKPLYRKVNTRTRNVSHLYGGDSRDERHLISDATRASMHGKERRGLNYTPLFKFLHSKVGEPWDEVFSEAVSRLDRQEPIFWLVARFAHEENEVVRIGESSFYSGLRIDEDGRLQFVSPTPDRERLPIQCSCCTHTFNGVRYTP